MTEEGRGDGPLRRQLRPSGPVSLSLAESQRGDTTIIAVTGELDVLTTPRMATRIDEIVRSRAGDLVLDLRGTEFMDSSGLSMLLSARRRLSQRGRGLTVVCGPGPVRSVIELSRLTDTLRVVASLDATD
jgi:anti-sigma B factor antagonist